MAAWPRSAARWSGVRPRERELLELPAAAGLGERLWSLCEKVSELKTILLDLPPAGFDSIYSIIWIMIAIDRCIRQHDSLTFLSWPPPFFPTNQNTCSSLLYPSGSSPAPLGPPTTVALGLDRRPSRQQQLHQLAMAIVGRKVQRCSALGSLCIPWPVVLWAGKKSRCLGRRGMSGGGAELGLGGLKGVVKCKAEVIVFVHGNWWEVK